MKICLIIVDVQVGFISEHTRSIIPKISSLLSGIVCTRIVFTRFVNRDGSAHRRLLRWNKLTTEEEQHIVPELSGRAVTIVEKYGYSGATPELLALLEKDRIELVLLCGIDTDCCVLKTAADLFEQNIRCVVLADYCASNGGGDSHEAGIKVLERLIGSDAVYRRSISADWLKSLARVTSD